jgi:Ca-activated chloride channel family protein
MKRLSARLALFFLLALLPGMAAALELRIVAPSPGEAIFGATEVRVELVPVAAGVSRVEFYLDGRRVGTVAAPPYRVIVDAGEENREHHIEVVAYGPTGPVASAERRTLSLRVDEQIDVQLQQLFVTVERQGQPVPGLERDDFEVFEDGQKQEVTSFESGEIPFTAAILLDGSASMAGGRLRTALDGTRAFVAALSANDEAKLLIFSDRLLLETPFTGLPAVLSLGLSGVTATGGTALNDSLYLALKRLEPRAGRKVVVLLSDGVDVDSVLGINEVRSALAGAGGAPGALLYWLRLRREEEAKGAFQISTAWRNPAAHRREMEQLHKLILSSGGRIVAIDRVEQVKDALTTILRELRGQYALGYYPTHVTAGGKLPKIEVRVKPRGVDVRVHRGDRGGKDAVR